MVHQDYGTANRTLLRQPVYAVPFLDESVVMLHSLPKVEAAGPPENALIAGGAACLSEGTAANLVSQPVLAQFRSRCLYIARSADSLNDRARTPQHA